MKILQWLVFLLLILFSNIKLDEKRTGEESTLATGRPHNSEGENLVEKFDKSGFGEVKTLTSDSCSFGLQRL